MTDKRILPVGNQRHAYACKARLSHFSAGVFENDLRLFTHAQEQVNR